MTQPKFAPIPMEDEVRPFSRLEIPPPWVPHRPGDLDEHGRRVQTPAGPDQGYLALLAEHYKDRIVLGAREYLEDVLKATIAIGLARASYFGRAPVTKDLEYALSAFGYFEEPSDELLVPRRELFGGAAHDEWQERTLVASFTPELLSMTPEQIASAKVWRTLSPERH